MMKNPGMFLVALVIGSLVTGVTYAFVRKEHTAEEAEEDMSADIDIDIDIA
jgi:PTS system fructose-specific IIC component